MRVTQLDAAGFGCLSQQRVALAPTLNLIVGPNEAGKSTLQQAILAVLYGLDDAGSDERGHAHWRPWAGGPFAVTMDLELQDGSRVRLTRDWARGHFEIVDPASGQDVRRRLGIHLEPGPALLGISRDVFLNTAFIARVDIARIEDPAAMRHALADLLENGQPDRSVRSAVDRLNAERQQRCGAPTAELGPLHETRARVEQLTHRLAQAEQARLELQALAVRCSALREGRRATDERAALLDHILRSQDLSGLEARCTQAKALSKALEDVSAQLGELHPFASFPSPLQPRVLELRTRLDVARAEGEAQRERESAGQEQLASLHAQLGDLRARAHELEAAAGPPTAEGDEEEVRRLAAALAVVETEMPVARERLQRREAAARHAEARMEGYSLTADWEERRLVFHKGFSQWMEQAQAAHQARDRIDLPTGAGLTPLQEEGERIKKADLVLDDILALEREQPARDERIQRASDRVRSAGMATLVLGVLVVLGALLAVYALFEDVPYYLGGLALAGLALLGCFLAAFKRQDLSRARQRLRREGEAAEARRRLLLEPFGVASGTDLQRLQIEHLERVHEDVARLEVQRQLASLDVRAQESATALQRLVASWGFSVPNGTETSFQQTAVLIERLVTDARAWGGAEEARVQARHQFDELERQRNSLQTRIREALPSGAGLGDQDSLAAADQFLSRRAARRRLDQVASQLEQARARVVQLEEPSRRRQEAEAEAVRFRDALADVYRAAGLATADTEAAHAQWEQGVRNESSYAVASARAGQLHTDLARVLEGAALEALATQVEQARAVLAETPAPSPEALVAFGSPPRATVDRMRNDLRRQCETGDHERLAAEHLLKERWNQLPEVAPLREDLATATEQLEHLTRLAAAFDLAAETIEASARQVRRDLAKGLARELSPRLARATEQRYVEAIVDEELAVRVRTPGGRLTRVEALSQGTRNLIYLLERLALAQWLSATREAIPLLLDDALAHCDARRLEQALAVLEELSGQSQVVLCTKDETLAGHPRVRRAWQVTRLQRPDVGAVVQESLAEAS